MASPYIVRTDPHWCFYRRADALCELVDTVLTADSVGSLPHFSSPLPH